MTKIEMVTSYKYFLWPTTRDKRPFANPLKHSTNANTCKHLKYLQNTKRFPLCKNNNIGSKMHDLQDADYFGLLLECGQWGLVS